MLERLSVSDYLNFFMRICGVYFSVLVVRELAFQFKYLFFVLNISYYGSIIFLYVDLEPLILQVLLFSTMTRLLDVMEDYLCWKKYKYLRLDGHTSGGDRGALIDQFNKPGSPFFIFLLR